MASPTDLSGLWRGTYFYDHPTQHAAEPNGVIFELHLTQNWLQRRFGKFSGTTNDDPAHGLPDLGKVYGQCRAASLRFIREFPVWYFTGRKTLNDCLRERGDHVEGDFAHPPVVYEGAFTSPREASGTWIIEAVDFSFAGSRSSIRCPRASGTFTLSR